MNNESYQITLFEIDTNNRLIEDFDTDTLFLNIYDYWCFCHYLTPYYLWGQYAMKLKENIIKKWPSNDFCNVNLFLELISFKNKDVDPTVYFWKSEDYFQHLMTLKSKFDLMVRERHLNINKKKENALDSKMIILSI